MYIGVSELFGIRKSERHVIHPLILYDMYLQLMYFSTVIFMTSVLLKAT